MVLGAVSLIAGFVRPLSGCQMWHWPPEGAPVAAATMMVVMGEPDSRKPRRKYTLAQARNLMRRAIQEIVDPGPASVDLLWDYFESRCAYCDVLLVRGERDAHTDHAAPDGGNHLGNLVLACGRCNGDEKRDEPWPDFLRRKAPDATALQHREERILAWFARHQRSTHTHGPEVEELLRRCEVLVDEFGAACNELKAASRREQSVRTDRP